MWLQHARMNSILLKSVHCPASGITYALVPVLLGLGRLPAYCTTLCMYQQHSSPTWRSFSFDSPSTKHMRSRKLTIISCMGCVGAKSSSNALRAGTFVY